MGKPKSVQIAQARGIRRKRSVGAYGSKRGTPDKQVHRAEVRAADPRVQQSMSAAQREQAALEARIAREQQQPALGETPGARYTHEQEAQEAARKAAAQAAAAAREASIRAGHRFEPWEGDPKPGWTIGQARSLLRSGYTVKHVMKLCGVGYKWLADISLDCDCRGLPE